MLQVREPVSRHLSYLHMRRRLGEDSLSVTIATAMQLNQWAKHHRAIPEIQHLPSVMSAVHKCSVSMAASNSSAYCFEMARLGASLGARIISGCTIRAVESIGPDHTTHLEKAIDGPCLQHNYPPVRFRPQ